MGRKTKLDPATQGRIVEAISLGSTYEMAAQYGGITYTTFRTWMDKGEAARSGQFLAFFEAVKEAEGKAVVGWLTKIEKAADEGNWSAAAWKLERRYPKDYGRQVVQQEISGPDGDALKIEIEYVNDWRAE